MYVEYIRAEITPIQGKNHTYPYGDSLLGVRATKNHKTLELFNTRTVATLLSTVLVLISARLINNRFTKCRRAFR